MGRHSQLLSKKFAGGSVEGLDFSTLAKGVTKPHRVGFGDQALGDCASSIALQKLRLAATEARLEAIGRILNKAIISLESGDFEAANTAALAALEIDEKSGLAWHILGIGREKLGDLNNALRCYEAAHDLLANPQIVAVDLGRLAYRMNMKDVAESLFRKVLSLDPNQAEAANNLACILKELDRGEEAIEILKAAIARNPADPSLWNTVGTIVSEQGDMANAMIFYGEALSHDPEFAKARYNIANSKYLTGDLDGALMDCNAALAMKTTPDEAAMMRLARASIQLCLGQLRSGWSDYEVRLDRLFSGSTQFVFNRPKWEPQTDLAGKSMLVIGEQGLGDEVLFGSVLPDLFADLGPHGRLSLAVEPRLVPLFARRFASVKVVPHETYSLNQITVRLVPCIERPEDIDIWAPLGSLPGHYRSSLSAFPKANAFLAADPARIAHWRDALRQAPPGPKVGILWKSLKMAGLRNRAFSPFQLWEPILRTPGLCFVNFQYGDCEAELAFAKSQMGIEIWQPPGIDLRNDLDDVAALSCALDLTVGFANATTNIAAACGNRVWLISPQSAWPRLGTDHMPWYPTAEVFVAEQSGDWAPTMSAVAARLAQTVANGQGG
jgi:tetratricopeptide (TPR) repeat protein